MKSGSKRALGAVGAAVAVLALTGGPALADPGEFRPLAGTGSDTTQHVLNALGEVIVTPQGAKVIGSYDAVGSSQIKSRPAGPQFNRPNGSGNGLRALSASIQGANWPASGGVNIGGQLDFARSSSGPSVAGTALTFIPFAQDAVSYAYSDIGTASVPPFLTDQELADIYSRKVTQFVDAAGQTHAYVPFLPQAGSGTRSFFLGQIGLTEDDVDWIDPQSYVQENDGSQIEGVGVLVPFSVASWIAQTNGVAPDTIDANAVKLGGLDDDVLGVVEPVQFGVLNTDFPFDRFVYNVVETARLASSLADDVLLQETFKGGGSYVCQAASTITDYGFGLIENCGDYTTYKSGFVS